MTANADYGAGDEDTTSSLDPDPETGDRYSRYRRQRRRRGLSVPSWGEYLATGQPLYDNDDPASPIDGGEA